MYDGPEEECEVEDTDGSDMSRSGLDDIILGGTKSIRSHEQMRDEN